MGSVNITPIGFGYVEAENVLPVLDAKLFIVLPPALDKASACYKYKRSMDFSLLQIFTLLHTWVRQAA